MSERSFDQAGLTRAAEDTFTVRRVFGEAYERDGRLVVPVARVTGLTGSGAGSGGGDLTPGEHEAEDPRSRTAHGTGDGGGGGFAAHVKPLGVYLVDQRGAHWQPALDLNRVILGGQVVVAAVASIWALAWAVRRR